MIAQGHTLLKLMRGHGAAIVVVLLCSAGAVLPLILRGPSCGHDFDFHLLSWMEVAHDWHLGLFDPHWLATANYGAGEPRFVFYPPISCLVGAAAGSVAHWTLAPVLFSFGAIVFAGLCFYGLAIALVPRHAALLATCIFLANPYLLFVAYERTAYGELLATGLIALLLFSALRDRVPVAQLACVIAALWLTNAPAAVMGCYTLAFVTLLRIVRGPRWAPLGKAAAGCALGIALAGFYLVPAAWEQHWVQIGRAVGEGMRVDDSFLFEHTGAAFHDQVLHTASWLVILILGIGFAAGIAAWRSGKRRIVLMFGALLGIILLLQFPVSAPLWHAAPHIAFLQFPWRWLLVASITAAVMIGGALSELREPTTRRCWRLGGALIIVAASVWACSHRFYQPCDDEDAVAGQLTVFYNGTGVEGTDEYAAKGADNSAIEQHLPEVRLLAEADADEPAAGVGDNPLWQIPMDGAPGSVKVIEWLPESKRVTVQALQPGYAVLRLMDYPAWLVIENGRAMAARPAREDGLMAVPVPAGISNIEIRWKTTSDVWWGRGLSLTALLILALSSPITGLLRPGVSEQ